MATEPGGLSFSHPVAAQFAWPAASGHQGRPQQLCDNAGGVKLSSRTPCLAVGTISIAEVQRVVDGVRSTAASEQ